jgi:hypothetical protein
LVGDFKFYCLPLILFWDLVFMFRASRPLQLFSDIFKNIHCVTGNIVLCNFLLLLARSGYSVIVASDAELHQFSASIFVLLVYTVCSGPCYFFIHLVGLTP